MMYLASKTDTKANAAVVEVFEGNLRWIRFSLEDGKLAVSGMHRGRGNTSWEYAITFDDLEKLLRPPFVEESP